MSLIDNTINIILKHYEKDTTPWILGYSGGKDSTALLILVYNAVKLSKNKTREVIVVYCDTGVEIPIVKDYAHDTLNALQNEAKDDCLPINTIIQYPSVEDSYFSKVIGRGYPTPTNKFRWCTNRLRVKPMQSIVLNNYKEKIVLLGVRKGESVERDRIIQKHSLDDEYYFKQAKYKNTKVFSPIIEFNVSDVWNAIDTLSKPFSINRVILKDMYEIVSDVKLDNKIEDNIKIKGRFGCWTCTVIRKDKAMMQLVEYGYSELKPLYEFRNWLMVIRDNPEYRCSVRRNGQKGKGPFTLKARREILNRLLEAQAESKICLISEKELNYIYKLWDEDNKSDKYIEHYSDIDN